MPFDRETGKPTISFGDGEDYTSITAEYIMQKAKSDSEFLVITPAMQCRLKSGAAKGAWIAVCGCRDCGGTGGCHGIWCSKKRCETACGY